MNVKGLVSKYLKSRGVVATKNALGLNFTYEGWNFLFWNDADDPLFFRLTLPGIFDVTDENRATVLEAINEVNRVMKVAKTLVPRNSVWIYAEMLMDSTPVLDDMVPRLLNILMSARQEFYDQIG